jgi:Family of unknown function (DUF6714)
MAIATADAIIAAIEAGFARTTRPSAPFLQGSHEGCEPGEAVEPFLHIQDWRGIPPVTLDGCYTALSFFSEGGFRFFLPAFMVADVRDELQTADPVFHLTHGFQSISVKVPDGVVTSGGTALLNPRRFGAITWEDTARFRLSVFTREEAAAIVTYLTWRRDRDTTGVARAAIIAALDSFWIERARSAPPADQLGGF